MTLFNLTLLIAITLNGLLAGVFFTWTNAITPGLGKLSTLNYLAAFQSMNKSILNPLFFIVFFGPIVFSPIAIFLQNFNQIDITVWLIIAVFMLYGIGVIGITFLVNIPLNNRLDKLDLKMITQESASQFRISFEARWNNFHLIRTISSTLSFVLLIISLLISNL